MHVVVCEGNRFGSDALRREFLAPTLAGERVCSIAVSEPGAGSDVAGVTTTARRDGSDWILSGQKVYISGVDQAQAILVVGRTEEAKTGNLKPALFVVPTDTPGLSWTKIDMEIVSPEFQFQVFLDEVRVGPDEGPVGVVDAWPVRRDVGVAGRQAVLAQQRREVVVDFLRPGPITGSRGTGGTR